MVDALENSLKACLDMFRPCDKFGYDAYRIMITGLDKKEYNFISSIVGSLIDARRAA